MRGQVFKRDVFMKSVGSDLPPDVADRLWAGQRAVSTVALSTPTAAAAWTTIPSWFFIRSGDQMITAESKERMAVHAQSHITQFHGGSHLTLISHPDAFTRTIDEAASSLSLGVLTAQSRPAVCLRFGLLSTARRSCGRRCRWMAATVASQ